MKRLITAILSVCILSGCATFPETKRTCRQPPWITNKTDPDPAVISVPAGESTTIDGPDKIARLTVGAGANVQAAKLESVLGSITIEDGATLVAINLRSAQSLIVDNNAILVAPQLRLVEVGVVGDDATVVAPWLRDCGGFRVGDGGKFDAPCAEQRVSKPRK